MERLQDRQVLGKILQESILQMCKVSIGLHCNINIDGIVCIAIQGEDKEIIVKIHEQVSRGLESTDINKTQSMMSTVVPTPTQSHSVARNILEKSNRTYGDPISSKQSDRSSIQNQISKDYFLGDEHELFGDLAAIRSIMPLNSADEDPLNHSAIEDTINLIDDESIEFSENLVDKPVCDLMNVKPDPGTVSSCTVTNVVPSQQEVCAVTSVVETRPSLKKGLHSRLSFAHSPLEESSDDDLKIEKLKAGRVRRHKRMPSESSTRLSPTDLVNVDAMHYTIDVEDPLVQTSKMRSHVNSDDTQILYDDVGNMDIKPVLRKRQLDSTKDIGSHSSQESFLNMSPQSNVDCVAQVVSRAEESNETLAPVVTRATSSYTTITPTVTAQNVMTNIKAQNIIPSINSENDNTVPSSYTNITPTNNDSKSSYLTNNPSSSDVSVVASFKNISPIIKGQKMEDKPAEVKKLISFKSTGVTVAQQLHLLRQKQLLLPDQAIENGQISDDIKVGDVPSNAFKQYRCPFCNVCDTVFKKHHMHMFQQHNVFPCPCCEKMFSHRYSRNRHIVSSHAGSKTFVCPFCSKKYVRADTLKLHIQKQHPGSVDHVKFHYSYAHSKQLYEPDSTEPSCSVTQDVVYNQNLPSKIEILDPEYHSGSQESLESINQKTVSNPMLSNCVSKSVTSTATLDGDINEDNNNSSNLTARVITDTSVSNQKAICVISENSNHSCPDNSKDTLTREACVSKNAIEDHARIVAEDPMVVVSRAFTPIDDDNDETEQEDHDVMQEMEHDDIIDMIEISDEEMNKDDEC